MEQDLCRCPQPLPDMRVQTGKALCEYCGQHITETVMQAAYKETPPHNCSPTIEDRDDNVIEPTCVFCGEPVERCKGITRKQMLEGVEQAKQDLDNGITIGVSHKKTNTGTAAYFQTVVENIHPASKSVSVADLEELGQDLLHRAKSANSLRENIQEDKTLYDARLGGKAFAYNHAAQMVRELVNHSGE